MESSHLPMQKLLFKHLHREPASDDLNYSSDVYLSGHTNPDIIYAVNHAPRYKIIWIKSGAQPDHVKNGPKDQVKRSCHS